MIENAIVATGIGKRFTIVAPGQRHNTLRDTIAAATKRMGAALLGGASRPATENFWALRDVNFEVRQGEVLGVIGRNGAGKSTLLKVLSRITEPTNGEILVRGRVGSLLEVGTGFHSELSGRENIFLNGAILGMTRSEITRKFDEIVAFAEVERFLDTPVKHYSSGMYLRLGFAVAAHLEPDILIVDEVLAVGDAEFQKKCLGKMGEVARDGRTVIFVSHNLDVVQRLCDRCLLLDHGRIVDDGETRSVVAGYLASGGGSTPPGVPVQLEDLARSGTGEVRFQSLSYGGDFGGRTAPVRPGGPLSVRVEIEATSATSLGSFAVSILSYEGQLLVNADSMILGEVVAVPAGRSAFEFRIDALGLLPGRYPVSLWAGDPAGGDGYDYIERAFELEVVAEVRQGLGATPSSNGVIFVDFSVAETKLFRDDVSS